MVIDDNLIEGFKNQISVLHKLQDSVAGAIARANHKLDKLLLNRGKNVEDVFGSPLSRRSPGQGGTGKGYR